MIIYATMSVKDEADILSHTIENALTWIDKIFVVDNGSEDSTQEILKQYGDRVILLATFHAPFHRGLKSIPFNWVNSIQSYPQADWWCIMDADEIYFDNPRRFLESIPEYFGQVCTNTIEFIGLKNTKYPLEPSSYSHYIPINWSETRFYRNTKALRWSTYGDNGPRGARATYHNRIRVLHFPFRSETQIRKRIESRNINRETSGIPWHNSNFASAESLVFEYNIENRVVNNGELEFLDTVQNFLTSPRQRLTRLMKIIAYKMRLLQ